MDRQELGRRGEDAAVRYLMSKGHVIVERNWRCHVGEVDIISLDGDAVVFTEVKTRRGQRAGAPEDAVGVIKRRRLTLLASAYLQRSRLSEVPFRIDVIAIAVTGERARLRHHIDAVAGA